MTSTLTPPLKWHGGKYYLASRIVDRMPSHVHYVEPYAGSLAVLLAKDPEDVSEVVNDLNGQLTNFWKVIQDDHLFARFHRIVEAVPFSEPEWLEARAGLLSTPEPISADEMVQQAAWFFVFCRQSMSGRCRDFAALTRNRTRRRMNEQASAWLTAVEGLPAVHARLKRVVVLHGSALDVIREQDGPGTLYYLDPPYLHDTRTAKKVYHFEMGLQDHRELLDLLRTVHGKVMLSGYPSGLYDAALAGWKRLTFDLPNNAAGGPGKRRMTEVVWCNF